MAGDLTMLREAEASNRAAAQSASEKVFELQCTLKALEEKVRD